MPLVFVPEGPFEVPVEHLPRGRRIAASRQMREFWERVGDDIAGAKGVYLFAMRAGRGFTPYYVGKAARQPFLRECYTPDKRNKFNAALAHQRGTPVIIFLPSPLRRGRTNLPAIAALEQEMIQYGYEKNPRLLNIHHASDPPKWNVQGVLRGGRGRRSEAAKAALKMMAIPR
mgnify:CR=1 FL=1